MFENYSKTEQVGLLVIFLLMTMITCFIFQFLAIFQIIYQWFKNICIYSSRCFIYIFSNFKKIEQEI